MKALLTTLQPKIKGFAAILTTLLLASCGSYYNSTQIEDGIYSSNTPVTETSEEVTTPEDKNSYYQQYFKTKAENLKSISEEEDAVFTDIEAYSTYESLDQDGYVVEEDVTQRYGGWGENAAPVTINVYDNGWGNYNFWNFGYYNYWGFNNYFFRPRWFGGLGWNGGWGGFNNGWGWGGWNNWGWGGWNGGFFGNPFWGNGYFGSPFCFNNPYGNGGFYGNALAYQGGIRDNFYRGRSSQDYTTRRSSRLAGRNGVTSRRGTNVGRRTNVNRNGLYSRDNSRRSIQRPNSSRTRPSVRSNNSRNSRPSVNRSSNSRSRPSARSSRPSSSRSSSMRSGRSSSRSMGSSRGGSSRRGGRR